MGDETAVPRRRGSVTWLVRVYAGVLAALLIVRFGVGDRWSWSFALNALFPYAFAPLPFVAAAAAYTRRKEWLAVAVVGVALWAVIWGGLFLLRREPPRGGRQLVVLSYNALGHARDASDTVRVIRDSAADLVALQELNPETAERIERELGAVYPHRWLDPRRGVTGAGLLSKHPLQRLPNPVPDPDWVGTPQTALVNVGGTPVTVIGFHAAAGPGRLAERERQARALADYARTHDGPLLLVGDLNATDQNAAHARITESMRDAWREVGFGFGHTFPGRPTARSGGSRPTVLGVPVPLWLVRIDYVFHSRHFDAVAAKIAWYGGQSDHRGVVVTLAIRQAFE